jgi:hypothetical protein
MNDGEAERDEDTEGNEQQQKQAGEGLSRSERKRRSGSERWPIAAHWKQAPRESLSHGFPPREEGRGP